MSRSISFVTVLVAASTLYGQAGNTGMTTSSVGLPGNTTLKSGAVTGNFNTDCQQKYYWTTASGSGYTLPAGTSTANCAIAIQNNDRSNTLAIHTGGVTLNGSTSDPAAIQVCPASPSICPVNLFTYDIANNVWAGSAGGSPGPTGATGGAGPAGPTGAINPACTFSVAATGCTIDTSSLLIPSANYNSILVECFTGASTTQTTLAITSYAYTTGAGNVASVAPAFSSAAAAGYCTANATGSTGATGATGPAGPGANLTNVALTNQTGSIGTTTILTCSAPVYCQYLVAAAMNCDALDTGAGTGTLSLNITYTYPTSNAGTSSSTFAIGTLPMTTCLPPTGATQTPVRILNVANGNTLRYATSGASGTYSYDLALSASLLQTK